MVRKTSHVMASGPPVVKAALWQDITKEELGDEKVQANESGVINNVVDSEEEALAMTRNFPSYLPNNIWEMPPYIAPTDDSNRRDEEMLSLVPHESGKPYNAYEILRHVLDSGSFFEIAPSYGSSRITGLARVNGYPVGVMINNPKFNGGSMDVAAVGKMVRLIALCDTFHLPIVNFASEPGFMVGLDSERRGMVRMAARACCAVGQSKIPWVTFIIQQAFGVAGALHTRTSGMRKHYAWPSASWGHMHIRGGTMATYRRIIESAPDPKAKMEEIDLRLKAITSPYRTAEAFGVEDIIDPRDTRPLLCFFIEGAQRVLKTQLGPAPAHRYLP